MPVADKNNNLPKIIRWGMFRRKKGYTLIEVLVAVFIVAVAVIGLAMGFSSGLGLVRKLRMVSVADRIAEEKMEELRGGIRQIPGPPDYSDTILEKPYTVTIAATSVEPALTQVTVTVSIKGTNTTRSLVTYFTEDGLTKTK
ncbi:hypothetical protein DRJ04_09830 [Candidatus Aerophobetes bacterium]|uniref:Prepilin-type N-terminal cleavage/methylation domain-containing protein n=1 Tax=Aerophobetes bacterium TaxID=2030807 RepID=A0A662D712_UNCAE|nr:MAG: hypothetical protein DRJ04_09830 [Candidatus Aerophobetes bacterium]